MAENQQAYSYQAPDEYIYNLLTGRGGRFGLLPGVEQYYASQLANLGRPDSSPFTYTGERIAGFSPREQLAMQMADQGIGSFQPYFNRAAGLSEEALATLAGGTSEAKAQLLRSLQQGEGYTRTGLDRAVGAEGELRGQLSEAERLAREGQTMADPYLTEGIAGIRTGRDEELGFLTEAAGGFRSGRDAELERVGEALGGVRTGTTEELAGLTEAARIGRGAVSAQDPYIQEALQQTRASTAGFDPSTISQYMDPYEDQVVQQAMRDIRESQAKSDIGRRASEVGQGAFGGARSRLTQEESDRVTGRGLMDAVSGIRSQGFQSSRDAAMGEFGRQRGAEAAAAGSTAGLGAQIGGARTGLASLLSGVAGQRGAARRGGAGQIAGFGSQLGAARRGVASELAGVGAQRGTARRGSAAEVAGLGSQRGAGLERLAGNIAGYGQGAYGAGMGTSGALTSGGQQLYGMGTGASSALSGLAGQLAGGQQTGAGAMSGYAGMLPGLMQGDVTNMMNLGSMNRARNQALMDLNYQNFVGQYNLPQQLMSGYANFLTGAGPLAGGVGYSGETNIQNPYTQTATGGGYAGYGPNFNLPGYKTGGRVIPEENKGLASLANKAPEVVRKMGFNPNSNKAQNGGLASRFPMTSRKMGTV